MNQLKQYCYNNLTANTAPIWHHSYIYSSDFEEKHAHPFLDSFAEDPKATRSKIQDLTARQFDRISRIQIEHPSGFFIDVDKNDILFLQNRSLEDHHLTDLMKNGMSIESIVAHAKKLPELNGDLLFEKILIQYNSPKQLEEEQQQASKPKRVRKPAHAAPKSMIWDGKMMHAKTGEFELIPHEDLLFLLSKHLTYEHFRQFNEKKISLHTVYGIIGFFPKLTGVDLYLKILEGAGPMPETTEFQEWEKNLLKKCSRGKKHHPKALVLRASWEEVQLKHPLSFHENREHFKRLHSIYNVCMRTIRDVSSLCKAIHEHSRDQPIDMLYVLANGGYNHIILGEYALITSKTKLQDCLSGLSEHSRIILTSFESGIKRVDGMVNMAELFYSHAPETVRVFAPKEHYLKAQFTLWNDTEGIGITARFWSMIAGYAGAHRSPYEMTLTI